MQGVGSANSRLRLAFASLIPGLTDCLFQRGRGSIGHGDFRRPNPHFLERWHNIELQFSKPSLLREPSVSANSALDHDASTLSSFPTTTAKVFRIPSRFSD
jgi:hypothetical protein